MAIDPTFDFMTLDWDGRIGWTLRRPVVQRLIGCKDRFIALGDPTTTGTVVTPAAGCFRRTTISRWQSTAVHEPHAMARCAAVGKTIVNSAMIDRVTASSNASSTRFGSASNGS
jgi:phosphoglucomutase